ncbi:MAG TPA: polymer-forming cytoskeletal protein, partial [Anaerolineae bacterium]|nr:polymer-forming cytoskeletal protein [Anaerolineae bacterium]
DVRSEEPVYIAADGVVAGDVYAPKVIIAGTVHGYVISMEVSVEGGGQIWGDVYASLLLVETGGTVHGWFSSIDENSYLLLCRGDEALPEEMLPMQRPPALMGGEHVTDDEAWLAQETGRVDILRRVRGEAAKALVARAELERAFEQRVEEMAGETMAEAARLRNDLTVAQADLLEYDKRQKELEAALAERDALVAEQSQKIEQLSTDLAERTATLDEVERQFDEVSKVKSEIEERFNDTDVNLQSERARAEVLTSRVENLETALQASLQRGSEQQEALIRWQELAEVAEGRVKELESDLLEARGRLDSNGKMLEMMRTRRDEIAQTLDEVTRKAQDEEERAEQAEADLAELTEKSIENEQLVAKLQEQNGVLKKKLTTAVQQATELRDRLLSTTPQTEEAKAALDVANKRIAELESQLRILEETVNERNTELDWYRENVQSNQGELEGLQTKVADLEMKTEQQEKTIKSQNDELLWFRESLQTAKEKAAEAHTRLKSQTEKLNQLQNELVEQTALADKWKTNVGNMTNLLYQAEERVKRMREQMERMGKEKTVNKGAMQEKVQQLTLQIEAMEGEIEYYAQEIDTQRKRLAEAQATLVERDVQIGRLKIDIEGHTEEMNKLRQAATNRVRRLEHDLNKAKQHLKRMSQQLKAKGGGEG